MIPSIRTLTCCVYLVRFAHLFRFLCFVYFGLICLRSVSYACLSEVPILDGFFGFL